jgi:hypothetical protein
MSDSSPFIKCILSVQRVRGRRPWPDQCRDAGRAGGASPALHPRRARALRQTGARILVLDDPKPFVPLVLSIRGKQVDYEAKAVTLAGRRYIVCRNHQEAKKDAADRASIVAALSSRGVTRPWSATSAIAAT